MNVLLFSHNRILHEDKKNAGVTGLYVPLRSHTKQYADITNPTQSSVKERYGDRDDPAPLWRQDGPYVTVYGSIMEEIAERRQSVSVYLPQDFVSPETDAFYYIFDRSWVVHGVRSKDDNGHNVWGVSLISASDDTVTDIVISSISERLVEGAVENIVVAVHNDEDLQEDLARTLKPFDVAPCTFDSLSVSKEVVPLYNHRDFGLLMVMLAVCMFFVLCASIAYWIFNHFELESEKQEIARVKDDIRKMQREKRLGHIKNPQQILDLINGGLPQAPSALIQSGAEVARNFGELEEISIGGATTSRGRGRGAPAAMANTSADATYRVRARVKLNEDSLLVDQERMGQSIVDRFSWVDFIERPARQANMLDIGVRIK